MRRYFKFLSAFILIPLARWYLRKQREYNYGDISVTVLPGVFHPGLFYSTKFVLDYLSDQNLEDKVFLELGCGSGLISVVAAKSGARVIASDLSSQAVQNTQVNAKRNNASIHILQSDLFDELKPLVFDWIVINPPYYAQSPKNEYELSWYCGEHFEYFQKLFEQLAHHIHDHSQVVMVLTKGCAIDEIRQIAGRRGFELHLVREKNVLFDEKDYLYRVAYQRPAP